MSKEDRSAQQQTPARKDRLALKLIEEAQRQYQRYQELCEAGVLLATQESLKPFVPDWNTPLVLVFRGPAKGTRAALLAQSAQ